MRRFEAASILLTILVIILPLTHLTHDVGSMETNETPETVTTFVSDTSWKVFDADPALGPATYLGHAQYVCLNLSYPSPCPAGATLYGWSAGGWTADLSSTPRASWIWAPDITGQTAPAEFNEFFFSKPFHVSGSPIATTISIAVDDFAEVRVNGQVVGSSGSITDFSAAASAQSSLKTFDLTPFLVAGVNVLTIRAENGAFGFCCPSNYSGNPAGVAFGGSFGIQGQ